MQKFNIQNYAYEFPFFSDCKDYCPVGVFSSLNRDKWAEVNCECYKSSTINSLLFYVPAVGGEIYCFHYENIPIQIY